MGKQIKNKVGLVFGELTVKSKLKGEGVEILYKCECSCGNHKIIKNYRLQTSGVKSCGCLKTNRLIKQNSSHGLSKHNLYNSWLNMKSRCNNNSNDNYKNYGARGIKVCDRWLGSEGFKNFIEDMGERPKGMTLDRIDNEGNYEPSNCKWSTAKEQVNNRRNTIYLTHQGETKSLMKWSEILGISASTLNSRFMNGWSHAKCLSTKVREKSNVKPVKFEHKGENLTLFMIAKKEVVDYKKLLRRMNKYNNCLESALNNLLK